MVHSFTGSYSDAYYYTDTLPKVSDEVKTRFDVERDVYLIVVDSSADRIEGDCGIAYLDGGPSLVVSAGNCVSGDYSITLIAHELGHDFNLEHDFRDNSYFRSYGNSRREFSACSAAALSGSPYLNQDDPVIATSNASPTKVHIAIWFYRNLRIMFFLRIGGCGHVGVEASAIPIFLTM